MVRSTSSARRARRIGWLLAAAMLAPGLAPAGEEPRARQPVALAFSPDGSRLFAANRAGGTLSAIDPDAAKVVAEAAVGRGLADVAALPDGRLLAVDRDGDVLVLVDPRGDDFREAGRLAVAADPVRVAARPDGKGGAVASLRSGRLTFFEVGAGLKVARTLHLPFRPRALVYLPGGAKLAVADAYAGKLAVVDAGAGSIDSVRELPAHNIGGLAVGPEGRRLLVAHQVLRRQSRSGFQEVLWGQLVNNQLRVLRLDALLDPSADDSALISGGQTIDLGMIGEGSGDPAGLAFDAAGNLVIALSGVDAVALIPKNSWNVVRIPVGEGPRAVVVRPGGGPAYVAGAFDDAVTVLAADKGKVVGSIALGARPEPDAVARGERLFFDAKLSLDGWMSCASCHTDGHTNGLVADTLGDGSYGAPKRVPSLLGVGATGPWAWDGSIGRLEDQVRKSIETTMRGRTPTDEQVRDLSAYLASLEPHPPAPAADPAQVERGREVFRSRDCATCHAPPAYTSAGRYDVGLVDEVGRREFNPPSLRGVAGRAPLLHDGRAATLEDVFRVVRHPEGEPMTDAEVADLAAFLRSL